MSDSEQFWKRRARIVCWKHNAAVWLAGWLPVVLACAVAATCAILVLRRQGVGLGGVWVGVAVALIGGALASLWLGRRRFFRIADGLVRLESILGLHNRLTAAAAGVGEWPEPVRTAGDRWQWCWGRVIFQVSGAVALVCAAAVVPLPGVTAVAAKPQTPPVAWAEVEAWADTLKGVVQPESLESLREQLDALRGQDPESWYDHASLEAGDSLHAETAGAIRDLQQNLQAAADQAAKLLASSDQGMSDRELQAMSQALSGALQKMASGRLPLNAELLKKLGKLDPKSALSPEKLAQLQKQLQEGGGACKKCLGDGQAGEMMTLQNGPPRTGKGGLGGGGVTAPLTAKDATDLHSTATESMSNDDISRALPGEVVALSAGAHPVEPSAPAPTAGGLVAVPGQGGEAVWKDSLTPHERETVAKFFQ